MNTTRTDPSSTSNRLRDEVSAAPSCARESQNETEPESLERQFVRSVFNQPGDARMPYRPTSLEPKLKPRDPATVPPIDRVLRALNAAGCDWRCSRDVDQWVAQCPTHDDTRPSLVIRRNHDGSVWLKCWSGACSKEGILAELGLEWRDLWEASERDFDRAKPVVRPLLPAHLRRAMVDLLWLDDERRAA
jgi:hypothetical protein